jgi:exodeoxyribonuclease V alpha subunit
VDPLATPVQTVQMRCLRRRRVRQNWIMHWRPAMFLQNDWQREIFNGTFGVVRAIGRGEDESNPDTVLGEIEWDTGLRTFTRGDLDYITYSFAVTYHKAPGSQFKKVIVPILSHPYLLDMSMICTAMTRAQMRVVFVCDQSMAREAVRIRKAALTNTGFEI